MRYNIIHTTWRWSAGQYFSWVRCYWREAVKTTCETPNKEVVVR
jgi:hypothetical protein